MTVKAQKSSQSQKSNQKNNGNKNNNSNNPTPTPGSGTKPTTAPDEVEMITLHYNDQNKAEVREQILSIRDKYVHVIVDEGVTIIGGGAFWGCRTLRV